MIGQRSAVRALQLSTWGRGPRNTVPLDADGENDTEDEEEEEEVDHNRNSHALVGLLDEYGDWGMILLTRLEFSGWILAVFALGVLVWSNTFYNFVPTAAFKDFSSIWYFPLLLQGVAAEVLRWTWRRPLAWRVVVVAYTSLCTLIAVIQFASAMYGAIAVYSPLVYTGSNGWYQVGIYFALAMTMVILLFELFHLLCAINLMPPPCCARRRQPGRDRDTTRLRTIRTAF
jgi:hypothetical protein